MATRANYVKIGMFVMLGVAAFVLIGIAIGVQRLRREKVSYYTYFNEAVTGLDVGAPVKARGVTIGEVGNITFAPDLRLIEVRSDLDVASLIRLGFRRPEKPDVRFPIPSDVRAQLASQGLTGVRFIALDYFDPKTNPPPPLDFPTPEKYIPAARSVQKTLEESVARAMDGLAELVDTLVRDEFGGKLVLVTEQANEVLRVLTQLLRAFDGNAIAHDTKATVEELHLAARKVNRVLDRVDGDGGLIATTQKSVSSFNEAGRNVSDTSRDLDATLNEIRAAAEAIRLLADALEREPDMLIKGRRVRSSR